MCLIFSNQQPPDTHVKCDRLQPGIEPVTKTCHWRMIQLDFVADTNTQHQLIGSLNFQHQIIAKTLRVF